MTITGSKRLVAGLFALFTCARKIAPDSSTPGGTPRKLMHIPLLALALTLALASPTLADEDTLTFALDKNSYRPGESISATFSHAPGHPNDWIGIYPRGVVPSGNPPSLIWFYTSGTRTGDQALAGGTVSFPEPNLPVGAYSAWFLAEDGYARLAGPVDFLVTSTDHPSWHLDEFRFPHSIAARPYNARLSAWAKLTSPELTFSKHDGPAWLEVAPDGALSGTPAFADAGENAFNIRVTDPHSNRHADATLIIPVYPTGQESVASIRIMTYNAWIRWKQVRDGFRKGIESIVLSGADIIGLQEANPPFPQIIAETLGWYHAEGFTGSTQIISRYPIVESLVDAHTSVVRIRLAEDPPRDIILANVHLDYITYGPYVAHLEGATAESVLAEDARSQRLPQVEAILEALARHIETADTTPVFLVGDFNVPSHLDWTAATADKNFGIGPVPWPVSLAVTRAGFTDSFRAVHPDPVDVPGDTWSPLFKGATPQDRIDRIYHLGQGVRPIAADTFTTEVEVIIVENPACRAGFAAAEISAESRARAIGNPANNTWPSDHAAVWVDFTLPHKQR